MFVTGGTTERLFLYLAHADLSQMSTGIYGLETEGEDIKTHIMHVDEALQRLNSVVYFFICFNSNIRL